MIRREWLVLVALVATQVGTTAWGHELWFQTPGKKASSDLRLTFGDSPAPGEAERVAEIAHAQVWRDGKPLAVKRLADGLEVQVPPDPPEVLSAYADRGIVDYQGDSFVITLAAYAQFRPLKRADNLALGVDDDQVRLLMIANDGEKPVVQAIWHGKPVADVPVKLFRGTAESTELRTDAQGQLACPDLKPGGVSLLIQVVTKTPGTKDGRPYSEIRRKATLMLAPDVLTTK